MKDRIGWSLLIFGAVYEVLTAISTADAKVNNITIEDTAWGKVYGPIESLNPTPVDVGTLSLIGGGVVLWLV